jgi:4-carboxymuconolactone decarboxylase
MPLKEQPVRLSSPRILPLRDEEFTEDQKKLLEPFGGRVLNIFRTLVRMPKAFEAFNRWGGYILSRRNSLPPREREIVVLRTGYLCKSGYEWAQHVKIAKREGLSDDEIARIKQGPDAGWSAPDAALLHACDELHERQFISDETWAALSEHFSEAQRMDLVFTVGQYTQVSMMLNTFGVQLEGDETVDPDLKG